MKREGGRSATEAMERKLEGKNPFASESEKAKEKKPVELLREEPKVEKIIGTDNNGCFHVLNFGCNALKNPFLGRISSGEYVLGNCILYSIQALFLIISIIIVIIISMKTDISGSILATSIEKYKTIIIYPSLIIWFFSLSLVAKRFHDFGKSGWNTLLFFIPVYNIYLAVKLAFFTGESKKNLYGDSPLKKQPESNLWYWIIPIVTSVLILILVVVPALIPRMNAPRLSPEGTMDGFVRVERPDGTSFLVPEDSYDEELFTEYFGQNQ